MTQTTPPAATKAASTAPRKAWVKPAIQKIRAGEAEIGTRDREDGSFTTS